MAAPQQQISQSRQHQEGDRDSGHQPTQHLLPGGYHTPGQGSQRRTVCGAERQCRQAEMSRIPLKLEAVQAEVSTQRRQQIALQGFAQDQHRIGRFVVFLAILGAVVREHADRHQMHGIAHCYQARLRYRCFVFGSLPGAVDQAVKSAGHKLQRVGRVSLTGPLAIARPVAAIEHVGALQAVGVDQIAADVVVSPFGIRFVHQLGDRFVPIAVVQCQLGDIAKFSRQHRTHQVAGAVDRQSVLAAGGKKGQAGDSHDTDNEDQSQWQHQVAEIGR